jgi:divalent metal cation (Fe/Co/Zn/Cd) transporter
MTAFDGGPLRRTQSQDRYWLLVGKGLASVTAGAITGSLALLLAGSLVVLPVLGCIKLRPAGRLRSRALRGDGVLSAAGAGLAAVALAGLAAERSLGWWQADPAAALLIALFLLREGWRTLREPGQV